MCQPFFLRIVDVWHVASQTVTMHCRFLRPGFVYFHFPFDCFENCVLALNFISRSTFTRFVFGSD